MTSAITTYLTRRKNRQAKAQSAASKATGRGLTSNTCHATAATGDRESEDNANKAAQGYQPDGDEGDNLAPAHGIAVSVLVGIVIWLAIIAVVLPDPNVVPWRSASGRYAQCKSRFKLHCDHKP